jgi:hypothetical protein
MALIRALASSLVGCGTERHRHAAHVRERGPQDQYEPCVFGGWHNDITWAVEHDRWPMLFDVPLSNIGDVITAPWIVSKDLSWEFEQRFLKTELRSRKRVSDPDSRHSAAVKQ